MTNLIGDVSSSARILPDLDGAKLFISRAQGPYVWDTDGKRYVDTALGFGAVLLGHSPKAVVDAVSEALRSGAAPSFAHTHEHPAASLLANYTGALSKIMFTNSGSEAVHLACRAARAFTGKPVIAKMAAGFDGWFDEVTLANVGTREAVFTDGQRPATNQMTALRFNDEADLEQLFRERDDIAAILYEPMLANAGCILPKPGYLQKVQDVARKNGALLISDEVLMGFRLHAGLTSHLWGLDPDIATVGKAIGTGVPVAGVVGKPHILAPFQEGRVARGGTYSGNPLACAALMSTVSALGNKSYAELNRRGEFLRGELEACFRAQGVEVGTSGFGTVFSIWPVSQVPGSYQLASTVSDNQFSNDLHLALRRHGLLMMPSAYGRLYLSFSHDDGVVAQMLQSFEKAAHELGHKIHSV